MSRTASVKRPGYWLRTVGLIVVTVVFGGPIVYVTLRAFKSTSEIIKDELPFSWFSMIPRDPTLVNFYHIFTDFHFGYNLLSSVIITVCQVVCGVIGCTLAGYAFARMRFKGRGLLFGVCMVAALIPIEAIFLPEYQIISKMGLVNTYIGAFLPFMMNPLGVFLMRQSFAELPNGIFESALIDGSSAMRSFFSVALPNVRAPLASLTLILSVWAWNSYLWPLIVLTDQRKQTAQVAQALFRSIPENPMDGELMSALMLSALPLVFLAIVLQKYYVRGLVTSGGK